MSRHTATTAPGTRSGIALLSVVVVLATLLLLGVLFSAVVELEVKANSYYREAGRTQIVAIDGLTRALAELRYDMWGVNENRAFKLANSGAALEFTDGDGPVSAYLAYSGGDVRDASSYTTPIIAPRSHWQRSVEDIGSHRVLTDYRWMMNSQTTVGITGEAWAEGLAPADYGDSGKALLQHAGAVYHDEFLPEGTDNHDLWQLGTHYNRGDVYYSFNRYYELTESNLETPVPARSTGMDWQGGDSKAAKEASLTREFIRLNKTDDDKPPFTYWGNLVRQAAHDMQWDYVDTRIAGDSFYKIFRTELVFYDSSTSAWRSNAAGVQDSHTANPGAPIRKADWFGGAEPHLGRTHIGDATWENGYDGQSGRSGPDQRHGAVNINHVNNDYTGEAYVARANKERKFWESGPGSKPVNPWLPWHYAESKWIYTYDPTGARRVGRFASMVFPDCGYPNINNFRYKSHFGGDSEGVRQREFLWGLDNGFLPRGLLIGQWKDPQNGGLQGKGGAQMITSNWVESIMSGWSSRWRWSDGVIRRTEKHAEEYGTFGTRAELNMLLRKDGLSIRFNDDEDGWLVQEDETAWSEAEKARAVAQDAEFIARNVTVHGYEVLMGPHWELDRLVIDALGFWNGHEQIPNGFWTYPTKWDSGFPMPPWRDKIEGSDILYPGRMSDSSYMNRTPEAQQTRNQIWYLLNDLEYYWGPKADTYTPYSAKNLSQPRDAAVAKSQFLGYVTAGMCDARYRDMGVDNWVKPVGPWWTARKNTGNGKWEARDWLDRPAWAFDMIDDGSKLHPHHPRAIGSGYLTSDTLTFSDPAQHGRDVRVTDLLNDYAQYHSLGYHHNFNISEVGNLSTAQVERLQADLRQVKAKGWGQYAEDAANPGEPQAWTDTELEDQKLDVRWKFFDVDGYGDNDGTNVSNFDWVPAELLLDQTDPLNNTGGGYAYVELVGDGLRQNEDGHWTRNLTYGKNHDGLDIARLSLYVADSNALISDTVAGVTITDVMRHPKTRIIAVDRNQYNDATNARYRHEYTKRDGSAYSDPHEAGDYFGGSVAQEFTAPVYMRAEDAGWSEAADGDPGPPRDRHIDDPDFMFSTTCYAGPGGYRPDGVSDFSGVAGRWVSDPPAVYTQQALPTFVTQWRDGSGDTGYWSVSDEKWAYHETDSDGNVETKWTDRLPNPYNFKWHGSGTTDVVTDEGMLPIYPAIVDSDEERDITSRHDLLRARPANRILILFDPVFNGNSVILAARTRDYVSTYKTKERKGNTFYWNDMDWSDALPSTTVDDDERLDLLAPDGSTAGPEYHRVLDAAFLPGQLRSGYACYDWLTNQHPRMWELTGNTYLEDGGKATPAWRSLKFDDASGDGLFQAGEELPAPWVSYDRQGTAGLDDPADADNSPHHMGPGWVHTEDSHSPRGRLNQLAWHHGLNSSFTLTYLPGAENKAGAGYKLVDITGKGELDEHITGLYGSNLDDTGLVAANLMADQCVLQSTTAWGDAVRGYEAFDSWARWHAIPTGFLPDATNGPAPWERTLRGLGRVAPIDRYFTFGYIHAGDGHEGDKGWGPLNPGDYIIWDRLDNDLDGRVGELTAQPRCPRNYTNPKSDSSGFYRSARAPDTEGNGHYLDDGAVVGRINVNEIAHIATLWHIVFGGTKTHHGWFIGSTSGEGDNFDWHTAIIGRKPFKGYNTWTDISTRSATLIGAATTPSYQQAFWYENQFADCDALSVPRHQSHRTNTNDLRLAGRWIYAGNSPVHTVYVTAQALDVHEQPLAETRLAATVERLWDGKLNLLDFGMSPAKDLDWVDPISLFNQE